MDKSQHPWPKLVPPRQDRRRERRLEVQKQRGEDRRDASDSPEHEDRSQDATEEDDHDDQEDELSEGGHGCATA